MTIRGIKNNIINRILDDKNIYNILNFERYTCDRISDLKNSVIYDYLILKLDQDFISIDVSENDSAFATESRQKDFIVTINFGLVEIYKDKGNKLDELSELLEKIVNELYPYRRRYKNTFILSERYGSSGYNCTILSTKQNNTRQISFVIEKEQ